MEFEALGPLSLKNIARPVEAFVLKPAAPLKPLERTLVQGSGEALPLPDKPSIAVLAFANMSSDPEQEYFSDGIADDIITELSRSHSLFVIARNSSFTYRGRSIDVKQVARELGVCYVVEGSVRRQGHRVRINAQLIDAMSGSHIWAERYDRQLGDIFAIQDEITAAVAKAVLPAVSDAELRRILRKPPESLGAWEAYQRGLWHEGRANLADSERAKGFFRQSIALDGAFAPAHRALARIFISEAPAYGTRWEEASKQAIDWARRAFALDQDDPEVLALLAQLAHFVGNRDECWDRITLALAIDPNSPGANFTKAGLLIFDGRPSEGRMPLLAAMRLDPHSPRGALFTTVLAASYYFERDYQSTVEVTKRALVRYPDYPRLYRWLAAALGQLGRTDEARAALQETIRRSPAVFDFFVRNRQPWYRPEDYEHSLDGLRKAGWEG
jgi:adenylate cyclase